MGGIFSVVDRWHIACAMLLVVVLAGGRSVGWSDELGDVEDPFAVDSRSEIPSAAALTAKRKQIETLFPMTNVRTAAQRNEMAAQLLETALETDDDSDAQYVLLELARELAIGSGDHDLAMQAIDELDAVFQVDGLALRAESFVEASPAVTDTAARKALVDAGIDLIDELFAGDRFLEAAKLIKSLQAVTAKTRDLEQRAVLTARQTQGSELFKGFKVAQTAIEALKKAPEDAEAALVAGKYYAFIKGDWERGLKLLSDASDSKLNELADRELKSPTDAAEQKGLGDAWAEVSGKGRGLEAAQQRARAAMWYQESQSGLSGLAKVEVAKKLQLLGKIAVDGGSPIGTTRIASRDPDTRPSGEAVAASDPTSGRKPPRTKPPKGIDFIPKGTEPIDLLKHYSYHPRALDARGRIDAQARTFPFYAGFFTLPEWFPEEYVLQLAVSSSTRPGGTGLTLNWNGKSIEGSSKLDGLPLDTIQVLTFVVRKDAAAYYLNGLPAGQWRWDLHGASLQDYRNGDKGQVFGSGYVSNFVRYHEFLLYPLGDDKPRVPDIRPMGTVLPLAGGEKQKRGAKVDLLKNLDMSKIEKDGTWVLDSGILGAQSDSGGSPRIVFPMQPPDEYDLEFTFARVKGSGDLFIHFPIRGHNASLGLDVFGGAGSVLGLGFGTGTDGPWLAREGSVIGSGPRKVNISVRNDRFQVFVDGRPYYDLPGEVKCVGNLVHTGDTPQIQIGTSSAFQFQSIMLTPYGEMRKK